MRFTTERTPDGGIYVTPSDALPALSAHRLDRELFNVRRLAADGYGAELPLIVQYAAAARASVTSTTDALPGTAAVHPLRSINAASTRVPNSQLPAFWAQVRDTGTPTARGAAAAVSKIWLDQKVTVALDKSVPQIGAPAAWQAGYDGTGVAVAVLDTGIDATHPDIAGKVLAAETFVPLSTSPADDHGHGTHVAATIVGSGAASGGRYKGVAPGAKLLVGKVLNQHGSGGTSEILRGMEWAVAQKARVVSMSLGTTSPSDGSDPLSQAVERLTASSGALFVIAAGNTGQNGARTVGAPGAAPSALTVGAVDSNDQLAAFSSRGPVVGTLAMKPEITAPGVGIVAARAAGTAMGTPVDEWYTAANGTSMATPHVAGAVAILAQQHVDWRADRLKSILVDTAKPDPTRTVYEVGAGRVDVGRAVEQRLVATESTVDFMLAAPTMPAPLRTVTVTNTGATELALDVSASLRDADGQPVEDRISVEPAAVTLPAGASAQVTVRFTAAGKPLGWSGGDLRFRDGTGADVLRLPIAVVNEEWHTISLRLVLPPRMVHEDVADWVLVRVDAPDQRLTIPMDHSDLTNEVFVADGVYLVYILAYLHNGPDGEAEWAFLTDPEVKVAGADRQFVMDGRLAKPVTVTGGRPTELTNLMLTQSRRMPWQPAGQDPYQLTMGAGWDPKYGLTRLIVMPTKPVTVGTFHLLAALNLAEQRVNMMLDGRRLDASYPHFYMAQPQVDMRGDRELVDVGTGTEEEIAGVDLRGKLALAQLPLITVNHVMNKPLLERLHAAGAVGVLAYYRNLRPVWGDIRHLASRGLRASVELPVYSVGANDTRMLRERLRQGSATLAVDNRANASYGYTLRYVESQVPDPPVFRVPDQSRLATREARYHTDGPADIQVVWQAAGTDGAGPMIGSDMVPRSGAWTEYIGPTSPNVLWHRSVAARDPEETDWDTYITHVMHENAMQVFAKPSRQTEDWFAGPPVPGTVRIDPQVRALASQVPWTAGRRMRWECVFCRNDAYATVFSSVTRGQSDHWSFLPNVTATHLYRDGKEIVADPGSAYRILPDDPSPTPYRLTQVFRPNPEQLPTLQRPTEIRTTWDYLSQTPTTNESPELFACGAAAGPCRVERLLLLDYNLSGVLSLDNAARAPGLARIPVRVYQQEGVSPTRIAGFQAHVSYDGGKHWSPVLAPGIGGQYHLLVGHPPKAGTVSLRVTAWDTAGNRVEQTMLDVYRTVRR